MTATGADVSRADFGGAGWHDVRRMPATVLQTLEDDGTYPNLYYGKNLLDEVPQDLYQQDWWYRTTFTAPPGHTTYQLSFPGINYRAEIWLNGHLVADANKVVGMYVDHELDVTPWINRGQANTLAVKVTPERALQDINGVELADSWFDWINWNYLGYQGPNKNPANGNSFVADRNAGIWKPVYLRTSGAVAIGDASVNTELPLPSTDTARLTIHSEPAQLLHRSRPRRTARHDQQAGQSRRAGRSARHARTRRATRGQLHPNGFRCAGARPSRPVVAVHDGRSRTCTTCDWSSSSSTGRSTRRPSASACAPSRRAATTTSAFPSWARAEASISRSTAATSWSAARRTRPTCSTATTPTATTPSWPTPATSG